MRCDSISATKVRELRGEFANDVREWPTAEGEVSPLTQRRAGTVQPNRLTDLFGDRD
jgi:hypothetical protein